MSEDAMGGKAINIVVMKGQQYTTRSGFRVTRTWARRDDMKMSLLSTIRKHIDREIHSIQLFDAIIASVKPQSAQCLCYILRQNGHLVKRELGGVDVVKAVGILVLDCCLQIINSVIIAKFN